MVRMQFFGVRMSNLPKVCRYTTVSLTDIPLQNSRQSLRISVRSRTRAILRIIPNIFATRGVPRGAVIYARERPTRRIQCDGTIDEKRIRERLIEVGRVPLTHQIRQNLRLRDECMESVRRVARRGVGKKVHIDGFLDHAGPRDGVRHDDVFDLGAEFRWRC